MRKILAFIMALALVIGTTVTPAMAGTVTGENTACVIRGSGESSEVTVFLSPLAAEYGAQLFGWEPYVTQHAPLVMIGPAPEYERLRLVGYIYIRMAEPPGVIAPVYQSGAGTNYAMVSAVSSEGSSSFVPPELISYRLPFADAVSGLAAWEDGQNGIFAEYLWGLDGENVITLDDGTDPPPGVKAYIQKCTLVPLEGVQLHPFSGGDRGVSAAYAANIVDLCD